MNLIDLQNRINTLISRFVVEVTGSTSAGRYDIALASERVLVPILKEVFDYSELKLLNTPEDPNTPAIDLGDSDKRIAFQVTAEKGIEKVKDALRGFVKYKRFENYDRLIIYILTERQKSYSQDSLEGIVSSHISFDEKHDIWDHKYLMQHINNISDINKLQRICSLLEEHFADFRENRQMELLYENPDDLFPEQLDDEISRDAMVNMLTENFKSRQNIQLVSGIKQSGKTTLLAQFARANRENSIVYFLDDHPLSHQPNIFLLNVCYQMNVLLSGSAPAQLEILNLAQLINVFQGLQAKIRDKASKEGKVYYLIVDGIERGLAGKIGERIIDLLPRGWKRLCVLSSCRADNIPTLPEYFKPEKFSILPFNRSETVQFFSDTDIDVSHRKTIHEKTGGLPGYLRIIKDTYLADPTKEFIVYDNINNLIGQQVERVLPKLDSLTLQSLRFLAISPAPLEVEILAYLISTEKSVLLANLSTNPLLRIDATRSRVSFSSQLAQEEVYKGLDQQQVAELTKQLQQTLETYAPDAPVLDLLYREAKDYKGFQKAFLPSAVWSTISASGVSRVVQRLRLLSELAQENNDIPGLIKWTLGMAIVKGFVDQAIDQDEIAALLAIGEEKKALRKIYALPDPASKIRLLARVYTHTLDQGGHVSREARDELLNMVRNLNTSNLERELLYEIIADLMLIFPDEALELLDKAFGDTDVESRPESTILNVDTISASAEDNLDRVMRRVDVSRVIRRALIGRPLSSILPELHASTTNAKELIIRDWCRFHKEDKGLVDAINLWIDTIEADRSFSVSLRALRQMSGVVANLPTTVRLPLIERLKIQRYLALEAPREEWVSLRFTLAEALYPIDQVKALQDVNDIEAEILNKFIAYDELSFALARLLLTLHRILPNDKDRFQKTLVKFQEVFANLLEHSAEQFEVMRQTIEVLVRVDADTALLVAAELNTRSRRLQAYQTIIESLFNARAEEDMSNALGEALKWIKLISEGHLNRALLESSAYCSGTHFKVHENNVQKLLEFADNVGQNATKAMILSHIAVFYKSIDISRSEQIYRDAVDVWRKETDLKFQLHSGYQIVQIYSKANIEEALSLYTSIEKLADEPGFDLAIGNLGSVLVDILRLAIRSLSKIQFTDEGDLRKLIEFITSQIPSPQVRLEMNALLAERAYQVEAISEGHEYVQAKILSAIKLMEPGVEREVAIRDTLFVIHEYDPSEAKFLSDQLPISLRNRAWLLVIFWVICRQQTQDLPINFHSSNIVTFRPKLQQAINTLQHLSFDTSINAAIQFISRSIYVSFKGNKIDENQALDLLTSMDNFLTTSRCLPDKDNILHEGFLILCESSIHASRSRIYKCLSPGRRSIVKKDLDEKWRNLSSRARKVPNIADRALVMADIARDWHFHLDRDNTLAVSLLDEAYAEAVQISTTLDKINRIETIVEVLSLVGNKDQAKLAIRFAIDCLRTLRGVDYEEKAAAIIQMAYKIDETMAEETLKSLDQKRAIDHFQPSQAVIKIQELVQSPNRINKVSPDDEYADYVISRASNMLRADLAIGKGVVQDRNVIMSWLRQSQFGSVGTIVDVVGWTLDLADYAAKGTAAYGGENRYAPPDIFLSVIELVKHLANKYISSEQRAGIPEALEESFSGLSQHVLAIDLGKQEFARKWMQQWLSEHVDLHLKVCDPNFGLDSLRLLVGTPPTARVTIVTTDARLPEAEEEKSVKLAFEQHWREATSQAMPRLQLIIVPSSSTQKFTKRVAITQRGALIFTHSLHELGVSRAKIALLQKGEIADIEEQYVNQMLNLDTWFADDVEPIIIRVP
jgi:hypothetical protein